MRHIYRAVYAGLAGLAVLLSSGCGRRGDLLPPLRSLPERPVLEASRVGDELRIVVTQSGNREDGKPVAAPESARLLLTAGALQKIEDVPAAGEHRAETRMVIPPGAAQLTLSARWQDGRGRLSDSSAATVFRLPPLTEAVTAFTAAPDQTGVRLEFAAGGAPLKGLQLFRIDGATETLIAPLGADVHSYHLPVKKDGELLVLALRSVIETAPVVMTAGKQLQITWADTFPPSAPLSVQVFPGDKGVEVYFQPPDDPDAVAIIERQAGQGSFAPAARFAAKEGHFLDSHAPAEIPLTYRLCFEDQARSPNRSACVTAAAVWHAPAPGAAP
jgi:hypothetical protein